MKNFFFVITLLLSSSPLLGQNLNEDKQKIEADSLIIIDGDTLVYHYNEFQPYASGILELSNGPGAYFESLSGEVGVIWRNHWLAGAFATKFSGDVITKVVFPNDFELSYGHTGFLIGYKSDKKGYVDIRFTQKVSFGEMTWKRLEFNENFISDKFVIIHPTIGIDINMVANVKLIGNLGYRKFLGLDLARTNLVDFDGVTIQLGLSFGLFNYLEK